MQVSQPKQQEFELAWVIEDFVAYSPKEGKAQKYHADQIISVSKYKLRELQQKGFVLPVVFSRNKFNLITNPFGRCD